MRTLINVSYALPPPAREAEPCTLGVTPSSTTDIVSDRYDILRVGWSRAPDVGASVQSRHVESSEGIQKQIPVYLDEKDIQNSYNGFCNRSLWPLLHYIPTQSRYDEAWYAQYRKVNEAFADRILEVAHDDDMVWVHDYHLMLLPLLLKERNPTLRVGFFLHTPFPSYELFRCHPNREALLSGVLGADLIGFQTFGYLRHFRSTVLRVLGIDSEINAISHEGHRTHMGVYPVGVKWDRINATQQSQQYHQFVAEYRKTYAKKKVVLSADRLDYSKGLLNKLAAIETFLKDNPEQHDHVVFVILTTPSEASRVQYVDLTHDVEHAIGRINGQYSSLSNIPIHFVNQWVPFTQLCALYTVADVALVTPLMDGMNLIAKEYLACKQDSCGALILSEFAGASQELFKALMVNPYDNRQMSDAIKQALNMSADDKEQRQRSMRERIETYDSVHWVNSYLTDLERISLDPTDAALSLNEELTAQFKDRSTTKALFLDYDGTLREFVDNPSDAVPSEDLTRILDAFSSRTDLDVYIVSGRDRDFLDTHFGRYGFTLIGEHGYYFRRPNAEWQTLVGDVDLSWKDALLEVFHLYSLSTPGSSVEEKNSALVWHYRKSDPEFGAWKANELIGELTEAISNLPVSINHGRKIVEVGSQHISKGLAVMKFMNEKHYDLSLCAGDDKTDETMLYFHKASIITVKIGSTDTDAKYHTASPRRFREFLAAINEPEVKP